MDSRSMIPLVLRMPSVVPIESGMGGLGEEAELQLLYLVLQMLLLDAGVRDDVAQLESDGSILLDLVSDRVVRFESSLRSSRQ